MIQILQESVKGCRTGRNSLDKDKASRLLLWKSFLVYYRDALNAVLLNHAATTRCVCFLQNLQIGCTLLVVSHAVYTFC